MTDHSPAAPQEGTTPPTAEIVDDLRYWLEQYDAHTGVSEVRVLEVGPDIIEAARALVEHLASSPTVTPPQTPNGVSLITAERQRQIDAEGWTMAHDDTHKSGEMALAAAVYAWPTPRPFEIKAAWPWPGWFKPTTPEPEETQCGCRSAGDCPHFGTITPAAWRRARIRDLTKAGALIAAEIDRLSRAARSTPTEEKTNEA